MNQSINCYTIRKYQVYVCMRYVNEPELELSTCSPEHVCRLWAPCQKQMFDWTGALTLI